MAQTGYTPIQLYYSTTTSAAPTAGNLASGELAINITDGKLYYKDNGGVVQLLASKDANTNVASISFGTTGLTPATATTGAVTVAGTLALANGGTGATSAPAAMGNLIGYTTTATAAGTTTLTNASSYYQVFTGTTTQTVQLPVTSTLSLGWSYRIENKSTDNLTVNSSGGNLVGTVLPNTTAMVTCILTSGTTAASWDWSISEFSSTIPVSLGGTGQSSYTDGQLLIGNSSGNTLTKATLTAGTNITITNGNGSITIASTASGGFTSVSSISGNTNATAKVLYVMTASLTLTLPATPATGDYVGVSNRSGTTTCIIGRNSTNIMGLAEDMTVDVVDAGFTLYYSGVTNGWVVL